MLDDAFLKEFALAGERLLVFDRHSDEHSLEELVELNLKCRGKTADGVMYPAAFLESNNGSIYPQVGASECHSKASTEYSGNLFEFGRQSIPSIMHSGCEVRYYRGRTTVDLRGWKDGDIEKLLYNWRYLKQEDLSALKRGLGGVSLAVHIDPDCLRAEEQKSMAERFGCKQGSIERFMKTPRNPFYYGFGDVTAKDIECAFDLNITGFFLGEAFSYFDGLEQYHIDVGQSVIAYMAQEFLKKIPCRTKAYVIDNGIHLQERTSPIMPENPPDIICSALSPLNNLDEIITIDARCINKSNLDELLEARQGVLSQKYPIVVATTHAGAGFCMKDIPFKVA